MGSDSRLPERDYDAEPLPEGWTKRFLGNPYVTDGEAVFQLLLHTYENADKHEGGKDDVLAGMATYLLQYECARKNGMEFVMLKSLPKLETARRVAEIWHAFFKCKTPDIYYGEDDGTRPQGS